MIIIFLVGLSGSGKATIGKKVGERLNIPVVSLREAFHNIAVREGFARTRHWIAAVGVRAMLEKGREELATIISERAGNQPAVLVDDLIDPETPGIFRERGNKILSIRIKANRHLRKRWVARRMGTSRHEATKELRFLDTIKNEAGIAQVIQAADIEIRNFGKIDEAVNEITKKVESCLSFHTQGVERG